MLEYFERVATKQWQLPQLQAEGQVTRVVGITLEARGINAELGSRCLVQRPEGKPAEVEVVGFDGSCTFLMPLHRIDRLRPGARVVPIATDTQVPVGEALLGRVVDGIGVPLDDAGALRGASLVDFFPHPINPLQREPITQQLDVGIRSINAALSIGCGQRMGLFAGSGVGKSVLLGMMTRFTNADVVVVALVGERGREVREFIETSLGPAGLQKSIVVAAPADETPVMRLRAGLYASRIAEHFRDRGKRVLLLFDSLTRYAQAQREIALATGEPPATRGYPPSVFSRLPQLVERAGNGAGNGGSITGLYTVLTEGDDMNDPVADAARAILDGHVVLSRELAAQGIYPAVDLRASVSRAMQQIVSGVQWSMSARLVQLVARYAQSEDLVSVGAYTRGMDPLTDEAIDKQPAIRAFLSQALDDAVDVSESLTALEQVVNEAPQAPAEAGIEQAAETADPARLVAPGAAPVAAD
ncbi:MAG: FliI/YscN family ATPase [Gammaproteobacteria bacterium]|nr:FliI/YscN family ATPase [Gammaproteobacteria bacterium]